MGNEQNLLSNQKAGKLMNVTRNKLLKYGSNMQITPDRGLKMTNFRNHLLKACECIEKMSGIQYSKQDQLKQIDNLLAVGH